MPTRSHGSDEGSEIAAEGAIISSKNNITPTTTITASDTANLPNRLTVPDVDYGYRPVELLHDRLGHVGRCRLERTKNRSIGLDHLFKDYRLENHPVFCKACSKAKMPKGKHYRTSRYYPAAYMWQSVSMDLILIGPFREPTIAGARFVLTIIDRFSGYVYAYPMKKKTEVLEKFQRFLAEEHIARTPPQTVMTDWGTEFEDPFRSWARQHGIQLKRSNRYTAHENGLYIPLMKMASIYRS